MSRSIPADERQRRFEEVVAGYVDAVEAGRAESLEELLRRHPDLAEEIAAFFAHQQEVARLARSLKELAAPAPGGRSADQPPPLQGQVGDFRILREVGRGGMGVVYEAEQLSLNRRVALKVLPLAATLDPRHLQRFHNEARAAACLEHAHIVPVYGVGCERGVHFYAMKFIEGKNLAELNAARGPASRGRTPPEGGSQASAPGAPPGEGAPAAPAPDTRAAAATPTDTAPRDAAYFRRVAEWVIQAAEALDYAHGLGVVHRDVKPANLLLDAQGKLWVTDFGLARTAADTGLTLTGDLLGTLRYMSPEQALARHGLVDHRTDIYSLGATLYELLTGRPAVEGRDRQELLRRIGDEEPRPPSALDRAVPADLETVVLKALAKEPAERYATAREFADDLRRFLEHRPVLARRPGLRQRLVKWAGRHQAVVAAALSILVLAVLTLGVSTWLITRAHQDAVWHRDQAEQRARDLRRHLYPADIGAAHRAWQAGNLAQARELLSRYLPRPDQEELRGFEWYFLWDQCRPLETRVLAGHTGVVFCVAFAPDGTLLASASQDHTIRLWEAATGRERAVLEGHTRDVNHLHFSPDGKSLASWSDDGTARFWDVSGKQETLRWTAPPGGKVTGAAFMPDGTKVAFVQCDGAFEWWDVVGKRKCHCPHNWGGVPFISGTGCRDPRRLRLVLGNLTAQVSIWDLDAVWDADRQRLLHVFTLPSAARDLAASPDGRLVAAGTDDGPIHLLDITSRKEVALLTGHEGQVQAVAISADGRTLASAGHDETVLLWDLPSRMLYRLIRAESVVWSLAFSADGRFLASGGVDHRVRLHFLPPRRAGGCVHGYRDAFNSVRCSPDGTTLAIASVYPVARLPHLWDRKTGRPRAPGQPGSEIRPDASIGYAPDSKTLAVPAKAGVVLWDVATGQKRAGPLTGCCQAFAPDSPTVATGTPEGDILLWDTTTGAPRGRFVERQAGITCLAFAPDGQTLASGHTDGRVVLWHVGSGRRLDDQLPPHRGRVGFLVFSADGHTLVTAGPGDDAIHLWDVSGHRLDRSFPARSHRVLDLGLSPDGRTLGIANPSRVTLFHVATGQELFALERHSTGLPCINFSSDGQSLLTGFGEGGELIIWHAPRVGVAN